MACCQKTLKVGDRVFMVMGAANRDPSQFEQPDAFDIARKDNRHLSLGLGIHFCMGAALGRLEAQLTISELVRQAPKLTLGEAPLAWMETLTIRGVKALPVSLR